MKRSKRQLSLLSNQAMVRLESLSISNDAETACQNVDTCLKCALPLYWMTQNDKTGLQKWEKALDIMGQNMIKISQSTGKSLSSIYQRAVTAQVFKDLETKDRPTVWRMLNAQAHSDDEIYFQEEGLLLAKNYAALIAESPDIFDKNYDGEDLLPKTMMILESAEYIETHRPEAYQTDLLPIKKDHYLLSNEFLVNCFKDSLSNYGWDSSKQEDLYAQLMTLTLIKRMGRTKTSDLLLQHINPTAIEEDERDAALIYLDLRLANNSQLREIPTKYQHISDKPMRPRFIPEKSH